ncbi:MAG: stage III sporulation protein AG [Lachnospiraceae bacterium]|nr:stage III sporulation protein AG [Lachnospiraceae bacterium]
MRPEKNEDEKKTAGLQPGWMERMRQKKWKKTDFLVLALVGVLILVISLPTDSKTRDRESQVSQEEEEITARGDVESKLEKILGKIDGAGKVAVMITYEDEGTSVVEKDESSTKENSTEISGDSVTGTKSQVQRQEETVFDGEEQPFVVRELKPRIEGILVVAEGGDNTMVKQNISEAVMALFDVELHKIKIVKMK